MKVITKYNKRYSNQEKKNKKTEIIYKDFGIKRRKKIIWRKFRIRKIRF